MVVKKYDERYCDVKAFQPTFNEYGMCFTFNNRKQGMDHFFQTNYAPSKTVKNDSDSFHIDPPEKFETAEKKMDSSEDVNQEILKVYQLYWLPNISMFYLSRKSGVIAYLLTGTIVCT